MITVRQVDDGGFVAHAEVFVRLEGSEGEYSIGFIAIELEEDEIDDHPRKVMTMPDGSVIAAIRRMLDLKGR